MKTMKFLKLFENFIILNFFEIVWKFWKFWNFMKILNLKKKNEIFKFVKKKLNFKFLFFFILWFSNFMKILKFYEIF